MGRTMKRTMANRRNPNLCCTRCGKPILSDSQVCRWKGKVWLCVWPDDQTVMEVDGLLIKTGRSVSSRPLVMPDDPYAIDGDRENV